MLRRQLLLLLRVGLGLGRRRPLQAPPTSTTTSTPFSPSPVPTATPATLGVGASYGYELLVACWGWRLVCLWDAVGELLVFGAALLNWILRLVVVEKASTGPPQIQTLKTLDSSNPARVYFLDGNCRPWTEH